MCSAFVSVTEVTKWRSLFEHRRKRTMQPALHPEATERKEGEHQNRAAYSAKRRAFGVLAAVSLEQNGSGRFPER